jgi:hypothetical protein
MFLYMSVATVGTEHYHRLQCNERHVPISQRSHIDLTSALNWLIASPEKYQMFQFPSTCHQFDFHIIPIIHKMPVTVAKRSKACTVFARSEARTMGSNPTQGMDVWCLCTSRGLAMSSSPVQGVLPTVPDQETEETQPYAPKVGVSSQVLEQQGRKKNT